MSQKPDHVYRFNKGPQETVVLYLSNPVTADKCIFQVKYSNFNSQGIHMVSFGFWSLR